jgi:hypothetical protein
VGRPCPRPMDNRPSLRRLCSWNSYRQHLVNNLYLGFLALHSGQRIICTPPSHPLWWTIFPALVERFRTAVIAESLIVLRRVYGNKVDCCNVSCTIHLFFQRRTTSNGTVQSLPQTYSICDFFCSSYLGVRTFSDRCLFKFYEIAANCLLLQCTA